MNGGDRIARALARQGVRHLFTLCGGHISPILVAAKQCGIRVIDVRHEATAVFAADATARLTGTIGVAAVTAGPGCTNAITAIKNAQLAESPVLLLGGATATVLKGRGALQDIDQLSLFASCCKWVVAARRVRDLVPTIERAIRVAYEGVPGPVFVELPVDLLYDEPTVRELYGAKAAGDVRGLPELAREGYLRVHLARLFAGQDWHRPGPRVEPRPLPPPRAEVRRGLDLLRAAARPVALLGSQALVDPSRATPLVAAVERLGVPVYLSGMARGLLGPGHPQWLRHQRTAALKQADLVLLVGAVNDFRLGYGRHIGARAKLIVVNRAREAALKNRRPTLAVGADPARFLEELARAARAEGAPAWSQWLATLRRRDAEREGQIAEEAARAGDLVNPIAACKALDEALEDDSLLVADGGDFVATASYVVRPRGPLSWLDPGVFGTLGVGAGFALGAKLARPSAETWIVYGDGSAGYSLLELDTFARHGVPVVAVIGNDAGWAQIARDQVPLLHDDVGTVLARSGYHRVGEAFGARGFVVRARDELAPAFAGAKAALRAGSSAVINLHLDRSEFRKGSISM